MRYIELYSTREMELLAANMFDQYGSRRTDLVYGFSRETLLLYEGS